MTPWLALGVGESPTRGRVLATVLNHAAVAKLLEGTTLIVQYDGGTLVLGVSSPPAAALDALMTGGATSAVVEVVSDALAVPAVGTLHCGECSYTQELRPATLVRTDRDRRPICPNDGRPLFRVRPPVLGCEDVELG